MERPLMTTESEARPRRARFLLWFFSSPAAIFYALTGGWLCMDLEHFGSPAPVANYLMRLLLGAAVTRWVVGEAGRAGHQVSYDFPTFCFFSWPVFAPVFVFRTRGLRAFAVLGWFALIFVASVFLATGLVTLIERG